MKKFFELMKMGEIYLNDWPKQKALNCLFVDSKIVAYTQLGTRVLPLLVVMSMSLSLFYPLYFKWSATATFALFALSLPAQGLYWLGKRSDTFLPNQILPWYLAIEAKLNPREDNQVLTFRPKYRDLAILLKQAFKRGGDDFLQKHELI